MKLTFYLARVLNSFVGTEHDGAVVTKLSEDLHALLVGQGSHVRVAQIQLRRSSFNGCTESTIIPIA